MMGRQQANLVLSQLAKRFDISSLSLSDVNTVVLEFGDTHELIIEFDELTGQFVYWCIVGDLARLENDKEVLEIMKYLLGKNFPNNTMSGAFFALDIELEVVLLGKRQNFYPSESESFIQSTINFAELAVIVTREIMHGGWKPTGADEENHTYAPAECSDTERIIKA